MNRPERFCNGRQLSITGSCSPRSKVGLLFAVRGSKCFPFRVTDSENGGKYSISCLFLCYSIHFSIFTCINVLFPGGKYSISWLFLLVFYSFLYIFLYKCTFSRKQIFHIMLIFLIFYLFLSIFLYKCTFSRKKIFHIMLISLGIPFIPLYFPL